MKSLSIVLISFCVSVSICHDGIATSTKTSPSGNSAIMAMDSFYERFMPEHPQCGELAHGRMALHNKTWCSVFVGRKIAGKIQWAKEVRPGDYWYASKKDADDFCKGTR